MGPGLINQSKDSQTDQTSAQEQHQLLVLGVMGQASADRMAGRKKMVAQLQFPWTPVVSQAAAVKIVF